MNTRLISIQKTPAIYFGNKQSSLKPLVAEVITELQGSMTNPSEIRVSGLRSPEMTLAKAA
jgi:hypothetical protein